ncbi:calcium-binding mitochondrial carrier protein SCaMC-2-B-like [Selaginella moellendorffii]|uniref:calcium-binding mitochondrial carrier protein SCaMC-2-B-like n=1 Tax=Selaginella moellendorffii TaxID=88036 RepID=UPI000D1CDBFD|nr:calcium-binding mitochondrial carrier protein SCaMC-2-B-like [Selaginella moellendorffii]|eukprot:XP_024545072.1 calcium-binding mitochondrial carrier protein SCaMC-2-B-like [Selaginella moellendorffii]
MATAGMSKSQSGDDNSGARLFARFVAGGGAGITAAATTYPLDLVRTRLAAQTTSKQHTGIYLYKGLWPTLLARVVQDGDELDLRWSSRKCCLNRMQLEGDRRWTPGIVSALRHIVRTQGYAGLYRGILTEYLPAVGIAFMVYEVMKNISEGEEVNVNGPRTGVGQFQSRVPDFIPTVRYS